MTKLLRIAAWTLFVSTTGCPPLGQSSATRTSDSVKAEITPPAVSPVWSDARLAKAYADPRLDDYLEQSLRAQRRDGYTRTAHFYSELTGFYDGYISTHPAFLKRFRAEFKTYPPFDDREAIFVAKVLTYCTLPECHTDELYDAVHLIGPIRPKPEFVSMEVRIVAYESVVEVLGRYAGSGKSALIEILVRSIDSPDTYPEFKGPGDNTMARMAAATIPRTRSSLLALMRSDARAHETVKKMVGKSLAARELVASLNQPAPPVAEWLKK